MSDMPAGGEGQSIPPPKLPPHDAMMTTSDAAGAAPGLVVKGYSAAGLLGVLLFFLPWVNISCQDVTLVSQSGLQMVLGDFSENENADKELEKKFKGMDLGSGFQMSARSTDQQQTTVTNIARFDERGGSEAGVTLSQNDLDERGEPDDAFEHNAFDYPVGGLGQQGGMNFGPSSDGNNKEKIKKLREETGPYFPAAAAPAGFLLASILGFITLATKSPSKPVLPLIGGAIAFLSLAATMVIKLPIETAMFAGAPPEMNMDQFISVNHTIWFFLAVLMALLVLAGTIVHFVTTANSARSSVPGT